MDMKLLRNSISMYNRRRTIIASQTPQPVMEDLTKPEDEVILVDIFLRTIQAKEMEQIKQEFEAVRDEGSDQVIHLILEILFTL